MLLVHSWRTDILQRTIVKCKNLWSSYNLTNILKSLKLMILAIIAVYIIMKWRTSKANRLFAGVFLTIGTSTRERSSALTYNYIHTFLGEISKSNIIRNIWKRGSLFFQINSKIVESYKKMYNYSIMLDTPNDQALLKIENCYFLFVLFSLTCQK